MNLVQQRSKGYLQKETVVEAGFLLNEAMTMYTSLGFHVIKNYGQYINIPESVCMEKKLTC